MYAVWLNYWLDAQANTNCNIFKISNFARLVLTSSRQRRPDPGNGEQERARHAVVTRGDPLSAQQRTWAREREPRAPHAQRRATPTPVAFGVTERGASVGVGADK